MKTFSEQFEAFSKEQKKMYDFWTDASKKMMGTTNGNPTDGQALLKEWYDKQKAFFEDAMRIGDPKEAFEKAPDQFKKWSALQTEFAEKWIKFYEKNTPSFTTETPKNWDGDFRTWNEWLGNSSKWIRDNLMDKIPTNMRGHFDNFTKSYGDLSNYWDNFAKLIENGIYNKEVVEKYFSPDAYKSFVNSFMGFSNTKSLDEMLEQANAFFDKYVENWAKATPSVEGFVERWADETRKMAQTNTSPFFQFVADLNEQARQNLIPYYNVLGPTKEVEFSKIVRDIQFTYVSFLVKSSEMQTKVYQAGQFALPDLLKTYYEEYKDSQKLPEYKDFYNRYVNLLEDYITKVLESDEYSVLQNDVAKAGLAVKSKVDQLIELSFVDLPFVMRSEANEIAQEATSLRKKIRALERKIAALENQNTTEEGDEAAVSEEKVATKRTRKRTPKPTEE